MSCYSNKIESVCLRKCPYDDWLTNKAYLSAITVTSISECFAYKMAAKINWHRCGTKLRQCHPMYKNLCWCDVKNQTYMPIQLLPQHFVVFICVWTLYTVAFDNCFWRIKDEIRWDEIVVWISDDIWHVLHRATAEPLREFLTIIVLA